MPDALPPELVAPVRARRRSSGRSRAITLAAIVSLALHAALLGSAWLWARHRKPVALVAANTPPVVQLVMSPPGGKPQAAPAPRMPAPEVRAAKPRRHPAPAAPSAAKPARPAKDAAPQPAPQTPLASTAKLPPTTPSRTAKAEPRKSAAVAAARPATAPAPAPSDDRLSFNLPEAESDTNAWVTGNDVLPPTADVKYHNRKPSYPSQAVLHDEQGTVVVLIHVGADGLVQGVRVVQSSGYAALDRAAVEAVRTWHFLPSIRNGQPVPANMPARFVFELD